MSRQFPDPDKKEGITKETKNDLGLYIRPAVTEKVTAKIINNTSIDVLVFGLTGSGKTSILEALVSQDNILSDVSTFTPVAVTQHIDLYRSVRYADEKFERYTFNYYDTRGIGDPIRPATQLIEEWGDFISNKLPKIDKVLFVYNPDRLRANVSSELLVVLKYLQTLGVKKENMIMIISKCEFYNDHALSKFLTELNEEPNFSTILDSCKTVVKTGCPREIDWIDDNRLKELSRESIEQSKANLLSVLIEPSKPVYVREEQVKLWQESVIEDEKRRAEAEQHEISILHIKYKEDIAKRDQEIQKLQNRNCIIS